MKFKPTYLYIKQHTVTGKLYLGKTIRNPEKYLGSGLHWKNHIRFHGERFVVTLWHELFSDKNELVSFALMLSQKLDIVNSEHWLNLKAENGLDGGSAGGNFWSEESKRKLQDRIPWNKGTAKPKPPCIEKSTAYRGEGNPFFGKKHKEESKMYGDKNPAKRSEVRNKMTGPRPDFLPHNHYTGWSAETKNKISKSLMGRTLSENTKVKLRAAKKDLIWVHNGIDKPLQIKTCFLSNFVEKGYKRGRGPKTLW